MTVFFTPSGGLDVATDASSLPESGDRNESSSEALTRCKNLRINQKGVAITRDGSAKINDPAIDPDIWWIEEQGGDRYAFAGSEIYLNESSIESGLTSAQWVAIKYSSFNDTVEQVYALNGTDRKRIAGSDVYEWGIDAPTEAPILAVGSGVGLTGEYNAKYTYARKVADTLVAESNPSPAAANTIVLNNQSLSVDVTQPTDPQVTHIRFYRTLAGGEECYLAGEIEVASSYVYGYVFDWEFSDAYLGAYGFAFTTDDATHSTQNCYTWEETYLTHDSDDTSGSTGDFNPALDWWLNYNPAYQ